MLIGIGHKRRVGKSFTAALIRKHGFVIEQVVFPLKQIIQTCFPVTAKELEGDYKDTLIVPGVETTPRQLLLRTGRALEAEFPGFLQTRLRNILQLHAEEKNDVVIPDIRTLEEVKIVRELGGYLIRVDKNKLLDLDLDANRFEVELDRFSNWDYIINNDGSIKDLSQRVEEIMEDIHFQEMNRRDYGGYL